MGKYPDVDIDTGNRDDILKLIKYHPASIIKDQTQKHNTGVYINKICTDPRTGLSTIDYKEADQRGYFKLDILNVHVYENIKSEEHLNELMNTIPNWERLWTDKIFCEQIIHIGSYYELLKKMKPDSIPRMAMFLSIIRPSKKHLIGLDWKEIAKTVWEKPIDDQYYFKKSHSISYATLVQVHMNLIEQQEKII